MSDFLECVRFDHQARVQMEAKVHQEQVAELVKRMLEKVSEDLGPAVVQGRHEGKLEWLGSLVQDARNDPSFYYLLKNSGCAGVLKVMEAFELSKKALESEGITLEWRKKKILWGLITLGEDLWAVWQ